MSVTPEELAAFADGQLPGEEEARVAAAVEADPGLAAKVAAHQELKSKLSRHFAPILDEPVPERLSEMLGKSDDEAAEVVDFTAAKQRNDNKQRMPGWAWGGSAIAASLVAALVFTTQSGPGPTQEYADVRLASALDIQLVATQPSDAESRILLSFRNEVGEYCRAYSGADFSGIACRDSEGWRLEAIGDGSPAQQSEFRMAGSESDVLQQAQEMAVSGALSAEEEAAAQDAGWLE